MSKWFNYYSFDVMGDLAFGESYGMLESGQTHFAIKLLNDGMDPLGFAFPPWFFRLLTSISPLTASYRNFIYFCSAQLDKRMKMGKQDNPDISSVLIDHFQKTNAHKDKGALQLIHADARLIIVAGSDTTAATLVHVFYHLAKTPEVVRSLREELDALMGEDDEITHNKIQDAEHLNGVIHEALRLNPPVPSGVFRKIPPEGVDIGGTFIPGNTVIQMPNYVLGHGELVLVL